MQSWTMKMWRNVWNNMTTWKDCTFPLFTNFPTAFLHLINYSHVLHTSTINSQHHQWPFLLVLVNTYWSIFYSPFCTNTIFSFLWSLGFRTMCNYNRVKSKEIWPIIQTCVFTNRLRPTRMWGITPYTNSVHLFFSRVIANSR